MGHILGKFLCVIVVRNYNIAKYESKYDHNWTVTRVFSQCNTVEVVNRVGKMEL